MTRFPPISFTRFVKQGLALFAVGCALVASGVEANAQTKGKTSAPPPPAENKTFEDWGYTCEQRDKTKACYVFQNQGIQEKGRLIRLSIGAIGPKNEMMLVVHLPLGINLEQGGAYKIDEQDQVPFRLRQCTPEGCVAALAMDTATMNTLKTAKKWVFGVMIFGSDKTTAIPISLKGLPAAIAYMTKK